MADGLKKIHLQKTIATLFYLISVICLLFFVSCDSEASLEDDLRADISTKYTFYPYDPENTDSSFSVEKTYSIGTTLYASDFPTEESDGFKGKKSGYKINGWVYLKNPNGGNKELPEKITLNDDGTVKSILVTSAYAAFCVNEWLPVTYSVIFNGNGGYDSAGKNEQTQANFVYDEANVLNVNPFTREKYTFAGWGVSALQDPKSPSYGDGASVINLSGSEGEKVILYALWIADKVNLTFVSGEGIPKSDEEHVETVIPGDYIPDAEKAESWFTSPEGKVFDYWQYEYTDEAGYSIQGRFEAGELITQENYPADSMTLTAQYRWITYNVDFYSPGEEEEGELLESQTVIWNTSAYNPSDPVRKGYTFGGWFKDSLCSSGNEFDFSSAITSDTKIWAKWTAESRTVSFDLDGGEGNLTSVTITYEQLPYSPEVRPEKEGFLFNGWSPYSLTDENWDTSDITMTALWKPRGAIVGNPPLRLEIEYTATSIIVTAPESYQSYLWLVDSRAKTVSSNVLELPYSDYSDSKVHQLAVIASEAEEDMDDLAEVFKFKIQ